MLLMCKDEIVFNVDDETLICPALAPGILKQNPNKEMFVRWLQSRYSSSSNIAAKKLQDSVFGQDSRQRVNIVTHSFSLSDCYWVKECDDTTLFAEKSPYFASFWNGDGDYSGEAIPTLYTDGQLTKRWLDAEWLVKDSDNQEIGRPAGETARLEVECCELCASLDIPVNKIVRYSHNQVAVQNFTSPSCMLEQADLSGQLDVADFTIQDVIDVFGKCGINMLTVDAIVGNTDRHTGNFGFRRCPDTGNYLGMAPLYDFDWALNPMERDFALINNLVEIVKNTSTAVQVILVAEKVIDLRIRDEFKRRATILLDALAGTVKQNGKDVSKIIKTTTNTTYRDNNRIY